MKIFKKILYLVTTGLLLFANGLSAQLEHNVELGLSVVSNDNVYKMPKSSVSGFPIESDTGTQLDIGYEFRKEFGTDMDFFIDLGVASAMYGSDADETDIDLETGVDFVSRFAGKDKLKTKLGLFYSSHDKAYVSRTSGLVPVSGGQELEDRFSSTTTGVFVELDYHYDRNLKLSADIEFKDKDYKEDYTLLGKTTYDYAGWKIKPSIRYKINNQWAIKFSVPFRSREYTDRRAKDLAGADIVPSDLEYDYMGLDAEVSYKVSDMIKLRLGYAQLEREDNYDGALDYERSSFFGEITVSPDDISQVKLVYKAKDRDYDNALTAGIQRTVSKDDLSIKYQREIFKGSIEGLTLHAEYGDISVDHESPNFTYDQSVILVGVTWNP